MRKTKVLFALLAAFCFTAVSAQSASALSITGPTPFTGSGTTSQVFNIGTAVRVTCTTASITNGALAANNLGNASTNMAHFPISYTGCNAVISGITVPATVSTSCALWDVAPSNISGTPGSGTGRARVCASISIPSFGCVITVPSQIISSGVTYTNISGGGVNIVANIPGGTSGINWSQNGSCPGLPAGPPPFAGYQGSFRANGLTVIP